MVRGILGLRAKRVDGFALRIERPDGPPVTMNLRNFYAETRQLASDARAERLRRAVLAMVPQPRPATSRDAAPLLMPAVRTESWANEMAAAGGLAAVPVGRPLVPFIKVACAIDSEHTIQLPTALVTMLGAQRRRQAVERLAAGPLWVDHGLIFASEAGTPLDPSNVRRAVTATAKAAGIDGTVNPYTARHSAASLRLDAGHRSTRSPTSSATTRAPCCSTTATASIPSSLSAPTPHLPPPSPSSRPAPRPKPHAPSSTSCPPARPSCSHHHPTHLASAARGVRERLVRGRGSGKSSRPRRCRRVRSSAVEVVVSNQRPDLEDQAREAFRVRWPEFIFHDPISNAHVERVDRYFSDWDALLIDDDRVVAGGWGVPLRWDGSIEDLPDGYDGALVRSVEGYETQAGADTLCIMAVAVAADAARKGLAGAALTALRERAAAGGLARVICPVRPTLKAAYPLASMAQFAAWRRADRSSLDPWIRTHERLGATILGPAERSMVITGSVADWESWTGMAFPDSGRYVVPEALNPVSIDRQKDEGVYVEENLWIRHA